MSARLKLEIRKSTVIQAVSGRTPSGKRSRWPEIQKVGEEMQKGNGEVSIAAKRTECMDVLLH